MLTIEDDHFDPSTYLSGEVPDTSIDANIGEYSMHDLHRMLPLVHQQDTRRKIAARMLEDGSTENSLSILISMSQIEYAEQYEIAALHIAERGPVPTFVHALQCLMRNPKRKMKEESNSLLLHVCLQRWSEQSRSLLEWQDFIQRARFLDPELLQICQPHYLQVLHAAEESFAQRLA